MLADEPTASLDRKTGRDVIELLRRLAREQGVTVVVVTHDNRILDTADRVLHLEDGRLTSPTSAVMRETQTIMTSMARTYRQGEVARRASERTAQDLAADLARFTDESRRFQDALRSSESDAMSSMLEQVLEGFANKVRAMLEAESTTVFLVDLQRQQLWSKFARGPDGRPLEIHLPLGRGIAGAVAASGQARIVADAYDDPDFDRSTDDQTGFRTRSVLCVPVQGESGNIIAVVQVLNKKHAGLFNDEDERLLGEVSGPVSRVLQVWLEMEGRDAVETPAQT